MGMTQIESEIQTSAERVTNMPAGENKALALAAIQEARWFARQGRPDAARRSLGRTL